MSPSQHSSLQGLIELSRRDGVEIRPTLLRVLVDLYIQQPMHTESEAARFTELVCRLVERADPPTRIAVATRLAAYAGTPAAVALRLGREEMAVAEPLLRLSKALGAAEMHAILDLKSVPHAIALAARADLPQSVAARIAGHQPMTSTQPDYKPDQPIAGRFLETDQTERLRILAALQRLDPPESREWQTSIPVAILDRLERAAMRREPLEFARLLEHSLNVPPPVAERMISDPSGEPILILLRALAAPIETVTRILLLLNPDIGQSVERVFALTKLYETITEPVAQYLAQAWRDQPRRRAQHQPQVALDASDRRDARAVHTQIRYAHAAARGAARALDGSLGSVGCQIEEVTTGAVLDLDHPQIRIEFALARDMRLGLGVLDEIPRQD